MDRTRWDRASATLQPGPIESPQHDKGPQTSTGGPKLTSEDGPRLVAKRRSERESRHDGAEAHEGFSVT